MNIANDIRQPPIAASATIARLLLFGIVVLLSTVIHSTSYASSNCFSTKDILDNNVDQMLLPACDETAKIIHDIHLNRYPDVKSYENLGVSFSFFLRHFGIRNSMKSAPLDDVLFFIEITGVQNITAGDETQSLRQVAYWYSILAFKIDLIERDLKSGDLQTTRSHLAENIREASLRRYIHKNEIAHIQCFTEYDVPNYSFEIVISSPIVMECLKKKLQDK